MCVTVPPSRAWKRRDRALRAVEASRALAATLGGRKPCGVAERSGRAGQQRLASRLIANAIAVVTDEAGHGPRGQRAAVENHGQVDEALAGEFVPVADLRAWWDLACEAWQPTTFFSS